MSSPPSFSRLLTMLSFFSAIFLALSFYAGCGGSSDGVLPVSYSAGSQDIVAAEEEPLVIDNDDAYYAALEKKLNDELDVNHAPDKCAAQGLSKITLSSTTGEISTCST